MKSADRENADAILDTGAEGLRYFEVFGPRYREWTGNEPSGGGYHALAARYDQQRGMDLQPMRAVANALADEVEGRLAGDADTQRVRIAELPEHWNGSPAAGNAQRFLADVGTRTRTGIDLLRVVHTAATTAIDDLEDALRGKARAARTGFDADISAGKTPQQIDWLIDIARQHGDTSSESVRDRLRDVLPEQYVEDADPRSVCRDWLDHVFVGEIDVKVTEFAALCSHAHNAVCEAYERLGHALQAVAAVGFVSPGGQPSHGSDLTYTTDEPNYRAAAGLPYAETDPTGPLSMPQSQPRSVEQPQNWELSSTQNTDMGAPSSLALMTTPASAAHEDEAVGADDPSTVDSTEVSAPVETLVPERAAVRDDAVEQDEAVEQDGSVEQDGAATQNEASMSEQETAPDTSIASRGWTPSGIASVVTAASHITGTIPELVTAVGEVTGSLDEVITATGEAASSVISATGEAFPTVLDTDEPPDAAPPDAEVETDPTCDAPAGQPEPEPEITTAPDECEVFDDTGTGDDPVPAEESDETITTTPAPEPDPELEPEPEKTGAELPPPAEPLGYGTETAAVFPVGSRTSSIGVPPPH